MRRIGDGRPRILIEDPRQDEFVEPPVAYVDRWAELTSYSLESDEGDTTITSAYEGDGRRPWWLRCEAIQSTNQLSLWRLAWERSGETVAFRLAPHGNAEATEDAPHFAGSLIIGPRAPLGGSATDSAFVFEFEWRVIGEPEMLTEGLAE